MAGAGGAKPVRLFRWSSDSSFAASDSRYEVDGFSYSLYGSVDLDAAFIEGHATYGQRNHSLERSIVFDAGAVSVNELAESEFDGDDLILGIRARVPFEVDGFEVDAMIGVSYFDGKIDEFAEVGAGDLNLVVDEQSYDFFVTDIGVKFAYPFLNDDGTTIRPYLDIEYSLVDGRDERSVIAGFAIDPLSRRDILLTSDSEDDRDFFSLSAGLDALLDGVRLSAEYTTVFGLREADVHGISFTIGVPFGR